MGTPVACERTEVEKLEKDKAGVPFVDQTLLEDLVAGELEVTVLGANNLRNADGGVAMKMAKADLSDPKACILVEDTNDHLDKKRATAWTKCVDDCLDPFWNEQHTFQVQRSFPEDANFGDAEILVKDIDPLGKKDSLGGCSVAVLEKKKCEKAFREMHVLALSGQGAGEGKPHVAVEFCWLPSGPEDVPLKVHLNGATPFVGTLTVHVIAASGLENLDAKGMSFKKLRGKQDLSDPYCEVHVQTGPHAKSEQREKTKKKEDDCNPVWEESFNFSLNWLSEPTGAIEFAVWDWDKTGRDFLGEASIPLKEVGKPEMRDLKLRPNEKHRKKMKSDLGALRVKLEWEPLIPMSA